jgi:hypothetical protein
MGSPRVVVLLVALSGVACGGAKQTEAQSASDAKASQGPNAGSSTGATKTAGRAPSDAGSRHGATAAQPSGPPASSCHDPTNKDCEDWCVSTPKSCYDRCVDWCKRTH